MGTSRTDSDSLGYLYLDNICPSDICPYQEYLSCYRPDFDKTLKGGFFLSTTTTTTQQNGHQQQWQQQDLIY